MHQAPIRRILFSAEAIRARVAELAARIAADSPAPDIAAVAILKGSFVFAADLGRQLSAHDRHMTVDFLTLASYGRGTQSSGHVHLEEDIALDVRDRDLLVVDDILDSGLTLQKALALLRAHGARSIRTCVLLAKARPRVADVRADYVGFEIPNVFVVGYGLDVDGRYRELPYIGEYDEAAAQP